MILRKLFYLDKSPFRTRLAKELSPNGLDLIIASPRQTTWQEVFQQNLDLVVTHRTLIPAPIEETIRQTLEGVTDPPGLIVLTEGEDSERRASLLSAGCDAVLNDALAVKTLAKVLKAVLDKRRDQKVKSLSALSGSNVPKLEDFNRKSPVMRDFMGVVERLVDTDASLLILGETGVGKERLARAIHSASPRSAFPLITINCGALPENLLESELFGHEKGAFTGAHKARRGWIELADQGTLFLDEIGEMPLHLQVKLLRVLQDHTFQRLGGEKDLHVNIRIMAATNRELEEEVRNGSFRRDLYYRLSVVTLNVPPLRERREDIPELAQFFVLHFSKNLNREVQLLSPEALECLVRYSWPGNVRELMNIIERAVILCRGEEIQATDLPHNIAHRPLASFQKSGDESDPTFFSEDWFNPPWSEVRTRFLARLEKKYLEAVLKASRGRIGAAANQAGINPRSLYDKMRQYGLRKEEYK